MGSDNKSIVITSDDSPAGLGRFSRLKTIVKNWSRRKQLIVGATTLLLLVLIAWLIVDLSRGPAPPPKPLAVLTDAQVNLAVVNDLQKHNYTAAQMLITQQALNPNDKNNLMLLATVYEAEKNYSQALATYKQVQTRYGMDYALAMNLGQVEGLLKNKTAAISYYQQAITLIQKSNPPLSNAQTNIAGLQTMIKRLQ